jgi:hypothetical protein
VFATFKIIGCIAGFQIANSAPAEVVERLLLII